MAAGRHWVEECVPTFVDLTGAGAVASTGGGTGTGTGTGTGAGTGATGAPGAVAAYHRRQRTEAADRSDGTGEGAAAPRGLTLC